ncbi:hypothetical protein Ocin01_03629 [Orchesella cincta]|uniref:Uncharacterized protein n=1 Tax=Orchesella cincta TaxID=48709 RepID=A0A1D2NCQ7_ORCCI|nr:hypothetical protein Ocin01_03629 [Orchesella cincta]
MLFLKTPNKMGSVKVIVVLLFIVDLSVASKYIPRSPDDETNVTSEGMWQKATALSKNPPKMTQGASRFDVGGILTTYGMKQGGASVFALVVFPLLFPLMILLGIGMFIISMMGAGGVAVAGKRSDNIMENSVSNSYAAAGYKTDRNGYPITVTNRDGLAFDVVENDSCMERFACEILLRGGSTLVGKKMTLQLLRGLDVEPIILPNLALGKRSRKVWKCSSLKCNWEKWIPWSDKGGTANNGS